MTKKMTTKEKFIDFEKRERKGLKYLFDNFPIYKEIQISEIEGYNFFDCIMKSGNTNLMVEVKVRNINYKHYNEFYLDKKKVDNLINCFKELREDYNLKSIYYFSFFPESWALLIWDILNTPIKLKLDVSCQKSQAGSKEIINKDMFLFDKKYSEIINLKRI